MAAGEQYYPASLPLYHRRGGGPASAEEDYFSGELLCTSSWRSGLEHPLARGNLVLSALFIGLLLLMSLSPTEVTTCGCMAQGLDESYSLPGSNHHSHRHRLKFPQSKKKKPRLFAASPGRVLQPSSKKYKQQMMTAP